SVIPIDELYNLNTRIKDVDALRMTNVTFEKPKPGAKGPDPKVSARTVVRLLVKGEIARDRPGREPLDLLLATFTNETDNYWQVDLGSLKYDEVKRTFEFAVTVNRRPPSEQLRKLPAL